MRARGRATIRGLPFRLCESDVVIPPVCPVFGIPLKHCDGRAGPGSPSLDRLIPSLGYVPGNVIVVSHRANTVRGNATLAEMRRVIAYYAAVLRRAKRLKRERQRKGTT